MAIKLKTKIIILPLLFFSIALGLSCWHTQNVSKTELKAATLETMTAYSRTLAFGLDDASANIVQDIKGISVIPPVTAIMALQNHKDSANYLPLQEELNYSMATRTMVTSHIYAYLDIINLSGQIIASNNQDRIETSIYPTPSYLSAMSSGKVIIGPPFSKAQGSCFVPFYAPIISNGKVVGCIRAIVDFTVLSKKTLQRISFKDGYAIIVGPGGIVMAHPQTEFIMTPTDPEDLNDPSVKMAMLKKGTLQYEWNNSKWLAMFQTGADTNWTSVIKIDLDSLFASINEVEKHIFIISLIWLGIFGLLMTLTGRNLANGLLKTINYAKHIAKGDLDQKLSLKSQDEVGDLADSLRNMVFTLKNMISTSLEQQKKLEQISQHKTDFLANMSHEIRTPMNALVGFIALFRRDNLDEKQLNYLEKISIASRSMLQIINDVLDLSKIEQGKLSIENIEFSFHNTIEDINSIIAFSAHEKKCTYQVDIDPDIPNVLIGDPARIQQILFNLLGNAVKFTSAGQINLKIQLLNKNLHTKILFHVSDTGIGISQEQLSLLFNPFAQADSSISRRFGGTGLGLVISKKLIELMGGNIEVNSEPNKGSTFSFTIKVKIPSSPSEFTPKTNNYEKPSLNNKSILVVEDNEINQEIICTMLEACGTANIAIAVNGQDALDQVFTQRFDLIFMDMQMPIMDGLTATTKLRQHGQNKKHAWLASVPVIALTANALSTDMQRCLDAGMSNYISKPILPETLYQVLKKYLVDTEKGKNMDSRVHGNDESGLASF